LCLLLTNLLVITTLRCHHFWAANVCCAITVISTIIAACLIPKPAQSAMAVLFAIMTIVIARGMERTTYTAFHTLLQGEMSKRNQASELKHFIGNVAHDLKVSI
jgi:hypothetical protein